MALSHVWAEGCSATAWLEVDHRVDWAKTYMTVFDLLDRLCSHHHARKTLDGWALVDGQGQAGLRGAGRPATPP